MDMRRFGVKALYLIGSVKTGQVGPCSDIDLLAHCDGDAGKQEQLTLWCEGWGSSLSAINEAKTRLKTPGSLIDLHIITDEDIRQKTSFASMIGAHSNSARLLRKDAQNE